MENHVKNEQSTTQIEGMVNMYMNFDDINTEELSWNPKKTFVVMVSILEYENSKTAGWDKSTRRCKNLYEVLKKMGVPDENMYYLKEKEADSENFENKFIENLNKCDSESNFIFYYAGHGNRSQVKIEETDDSPKVVKYRFSNYDNLSNPNATQYSFDSIQQKLLDNFNGSLLILLADCCYSGCLQFMAEKIYEEKKCSTIAITSATELNESTGRWTFTDCMVELLSGMPLSEYSQDFINLNFTADYLKYNMGLVNNQKPNVYSSPNIDPQWFRLSENLNLKKDINNFKRSTSRIIENESNIESITKELEGLNIEHNSIENVIKLGVIKHYKVEDKNKLVRIIEREPDNSRSKVHWYDWNDYAESNDFWISDSELSDIKYKTYPEGSELKIEYKGEYFNCKVVKSDWIFHLVKYDDWSEYWNIWATDSNLKER